MTIYIIFKQQNRTDKEGKLYSKSSFLIGWMFENKCKDAVSYSNNIWTTFQKMISIVFWSFSFRYFFFRLYSFGTQRWKLDNWSHHTIQFYYALSARPRKASECHVQKNSCIKKQLCISLNDSLWTFNMPIEKGIREHYHNADTAFFSYTA